MAVNPNPSLWNSGDSAEISAINYGTGDAGSYVLSAAGTEYHIWNDKGNVLGSSDMTSVKVTVRDSDGLEVENITVQKWVEVKSTTVHAGTDGGSIADVSDDNMADFQPVGKEGYLGLGDIPADCYRKVFFRVNIPTSALKAGVTFKIYVTNQQPSSPIAKWFTGLFGDGVVYTGDKLEVTDNAGADSKIDIAAGWALINDIEVYLSKAQTYTISTTDATYKIYLTRTGVISSTTGSIPDNSIQLATVVISGNVVDSVTDTRVFIFNMALLDRTDGNFIVADGTNWIVESGATARTSMGAASRALDNLTSVAINAALVLGTSDAYALGSATKMWADLFLASGAVINFNNGDVTLTHSANILTLGGGNLALGANSITMTGSIADTTNRVTKAWFADLEVTNDITIGGTALAAIYQPLDGALTSISGLVYVSGSFIALTANDTYAVRTYAQTLTDIGGAASGANSDITSITGLTTPLGPAYGGSGVANNAANTLTFTGNYSLGLTLSANTAVTLPTSGTLLNENSNIDGGSF